MPAVGPHLVGAQAADHDVQPSLERGGAESRDSDEAVPGRGDAVQQDVSAMAEEDRVRAGRAHPDDGRGRRREAGRIRRGEHQAHEVLLVA